MMSVEEAWSKAIACGTGSEATVSKKVETDERNKGMLKLQNLL